MSVNKRLGCLGLDQPDLVAAPVDLLQPQRDDVAAAQPGRDRQRDHRVVPLPAGGPGLDPVEETAGLLAGKARQGPHPPRCGMREQAVYADVAEPGGVEEGEEPPERPHHVADARGPPGRHLDHEPPDVVHGDHAESVPAGPVEVGQEVPDLAGEQPRRSRSHLLAGRCGELLQDFTGAAGEPRVRARHPPGHPAGLLELQHHAGRLHQGVPPVPADLAVPRTLLLARGELIDHAARQRIKPLPLTELHDCLAALAIASDRVARQAHALNHAEHGISQPGHHRSHGTVPFHAVNPPPGRAWRHDHMSRERQEKRPHPHR